MITINISFCTSLEGESSTLKDLRNLSRGLNKNLSPMRDGEAAAERDVKFSYSVCVNCVIEYEFP